MEVARTFIDWGIEGISQQDVKTFRRINADLIAEAAEKYKDDAIFRSLRSRHEFRVAEVNNIAEGLKNSIDEYLADGDGKSAAKVTDTYLRAVRLLAEETGRLPQATQQNTYIAIMQNASPDERKRIAEQLRLMKEVRDEVLAIGAGEEIIDASFEDGTNENIG